MSRPFDLRRGFPAVKMPRMNPMDDGPLEFDPDTIGPGAFPVRFGRYEVNGTLGDGATARVFRAHLLGPANFRKPVALKIMRHDVRGRASTQNLLFDEARIGGRLVHPNLVETYDVGERGGRLYVAMQLVDGLTARQLMRLVDRLTPRAVLELGRQMADGLAHAHALRVDGRSAQLVHRDLKPANVLIGRDGIAHLADFGIARALGLTDAAPEGAIWGTLGYMSPEQAFGRGATQASDVFSLGVMLAEFATGKRFAPVKELPAYVLALKELGAGLDSLTRAVEAVVPGLGGIVARCVRLVPTERYPDGRAVAREIAELGVPAGRGLATQMQMLMGDEGGGSVVLEPAPGATSSALSGDVASPSDAEAAADEAIATLVTDAPVSPPSAPVGPGEVFVGRDAVKRRLVLRLGETDRLVTLVGLGGVGKSRLARAVAEALAPQLPGGHYTLDLGEVRTVESWLYLVAGALNVPVAPGERPAGLAARLGEALADRGPVLLVFDSFEHLVDLAREILTAWLRAAPEARFLVTARERLRLEAEEFVERIEPLPPAEARALFLARAAAHHPDHRFDDVMLDEVDVLVARLDGLPLAIELAAAHADDLAGDGAFADRLGALLDAAGGGRGRRGTLRGALDWSWSLLHPWERNALAQLSVFQGGFTLEAVQAVLDLSEHPDAPFPLYVLESLIEYSLVHPLPATGPSAAAVGAGDPGEAAESRFGLYRPVWAYAAEQLAVREGDAPAARDRHLAWFARYGEPAWLCALDTRGGLARRWALAREFENLSHAARHALTTLDDEAGPRLALAICEAAPLVHQQVQARELAQQVLAIGAAPRLRAWLMLRLALLWRAVAQADVALAIAVEVQRLAGELQDEPLVVRALDLVAACEVERAEPRPDAARAACGQGLARAEANADRVAVGWLLGRRGALTLLDADAALAVRFATQALTLHREVGNRRGEHEHTALLGRALMAQGRLAEAARTLKAGVVAARTGGDPESEACGLVALAELSLHTGRVPQARRLAEQAFQLFHDAGDTRRACLAEGVLAESLAASGDADGAAGLLEQAIETADALQSGAAMGALRAVLATVVARRGDTETARYLLKAADSFLRAAGDKAALAQMLCRRGEIECACANLVGAWTAYNEAARWALTLGAGPEAPLGRALSRLAGELTGA
jgi:predicted ATPase